jgi:serine/threonine-protein kinase RsbW
MPAATTAVSAKFPHPAPNLRPWRRRTLRTTRGIATVVRPILDALAAAGYTPEDTFGIRLALEEALVNAIKHGHRGDAAKRVRLRYHVGADCFLAEIADEGAGFDPYLVPDPLDPANWERDGGRGLFLMRHHMTWVRFNDAGNWVTLCKRRTPA